MAENEQTTQDPLAKKGQYAQAAMGGATDWRVLAAGGVAGLFMGGQIPAGMAVASAISAAVSVKKEHDEVAGQRVSSVDQTKNDKINWGMSGLTVGLIAAVTPIIPIGLVAIPAAAVASHFVGEVLKGGEEKELRTQQTALAAEETNIAYTAGSMDAANNIVGTGGFTSIHKSRKSGGANVQQQVIAQRDKEMSEAQFASVG